MQRAHTLPWRKYKTIIVLLSLVLLSSLLVVLPTYAAKRDDVTLRLVRFDMPRGFADGSWTRKKAKHRPEPDAVDWPTIKLNGNSIFETGSTQTTNLVRKGNPGNRPLFQEPHDNVLQPGNHWFRNVDWLWDQHHLYTTDRTARSWESQYELWTFPIIIQGVRDRDVENVSLSVDGQTIYTATGPYHSLTLLLPASEPTKPYQLKVNGRGPVSFHAGLQPIELGNPQDMAIPVDLTLPGTGPTIRVQNLTRPEVFPNRAEWDADVAALTQPKRELPTYTQNTESIKHHIGLDVPRSPTTVNFISLIHGMSGGSYYANVHKATVEFSKLGSVQDYADYLADTGYDRVFEQFPTKPKRAPSDPKSYENLAAALSNKGIQLGFDPEPDWKRPFLGNPNVAFFSYTLPDYHAPLYRDLQLTMQRFGRYPNLAGFSMGTDNAGYVTFWDWAPPIPNRPWGEAFNIFMNQSRTPIASSIGGGPKKYERGAGKQREFIDYVARYDETFKQYGYFAKAATEVDPKLIATTGSFGSSPGDGGSGGYPWASIPGKPMYEQMPVQQAYDWNEKHSSKPMHNVALLDRLRSYYPDKTTWALIDDFELFFGREARQRAYALALTRGIQAVGTSFLPNPTGSKAQPDKIAQQKELYAWIHKYGGAYAMTEPTPSLGILYVHPQELMRNVGSDIQGSHEGKVTEALFFTHAAGWPSKVITPDELQRGLPPSMKAILLVGLNNFDNSWHWYDSLTPALQQFVTNGGRILTDNESVSPVTATTTGMAVHSFVSQRDKDWTPELVKRNADNIRRLRAAMQEIPSPLAVSDRGTMWAIPTQSGDTQYLTVVNQNYDPSKNASVYVAPQRGKLTWNTTRPIYDVRLGRKLTPVEATKVDLTQDGFRWYALPPSDVSTPMVKVARGASGLYEATVTISNPTPITGIPVQLTVRKDNDAATVYSATGLTAKLPLAESDTAGSYTIEVTELLSGLSSSMKVKIGGTSVSTSASSVKVYDQSAIATFDQRRELPLTIALTPTQEANPQMLAQANRLVNFYTNRGRMVQLGRVEPKGVVVSLQPLKAVQRYPQWKTINSDLILLGTPSTNVLLLDQMRGYLLPAKADNIAEATAVIDYVYSPFVGEYNAINVIANDVNSVTAGVDYLLDVSS